MGATYFGGTNAAHPKQLADPAMLSVWDSPDIAFTAVYDGNSAKTEVGKAPRA